MLSAKTLQEIANNFRQNKQPKLDNWAAMLADNIYNWCDECARDGDLECIIEQADLHSLVPSDLLYAGDNMIFSVMVIVKQTFTKNGFIFTIDNFDPKLKSESTSINSISISWGEKC